MCTSLITYVFSYVCALTHFPPLPPMTTCGVIQVHQVRISRELCTCVYINIPVYTYTLLCDTILFLSSLTNTCLVGYVTPNRFTRLEHTQDQLQTILLYLKHNPRVCETFFSLFSLINTCGLLPTRVSR